METQQLNPEARSLLDDYIRKQAKQASRRTWGIVVGVLVTNFAVVGTVFSYLNRNAEQAAVEYVAAETERLREAHEFLDTLVKQQMLTVNESFGEAEELIGRTRETSESLVGELNRFEQRMTDELTASKKRLAEVNAQVDSGLARARESLSQLHEQVDEQGRAALARQQELARTIQTDLPREQTRLRQLQADIEGLTEQVTGLRGEHTTAALRRLQSLAEALKSGEPAEQLVSLRERLEELRHLVHEGRFQALVCTSLDVQSEGGQAAVRLGSEAPGGVVRCYGTDGDAIATLGAGPNGDGTILLTAEEGHHTMQAGSNDAGTYLDLAGPSGRSFLRARAVPEGAGQLAVYSGDGGPLTVMGQSTGGGGGIWVYSPGDRTEQASITVDSRGYGEVVVRNPGGTLVKRLRVAE